MDRPIAERVESIEYYQRCQSILMNVAESTLTLTKLHLRQTIDSKISMLENHVRHQFIPPPNHPRPSYAFALEGLD